MTRKSRRKKSKKWLYWIPAILWMALIFKASSQPYEEQDLRPLIRERVPEAVVEQYLGDFKVNYSGREISVETKGVPGFIEFFIRKGAHVFVFMVLAMLIQWVVQRTWLPGMRGYAFTFIVSFLYACADEFHQSFNPNRSAKWEDVGIDLIGVCIGLLLMFLINVWNVVRRHLRRGIQGS